MNCSCTHVGQSRSRRVSRYVEYIDEGKTKTLNLEDGHHVTFQDAIQDSNCEPHCSWTVKSNPCTSTKFRTR